MNSHREAPGYVREKKPNVTVTGCTLTNVPSEFQWKKKKKRHEGKPRRLGIVKSPPSLVWLLSLNKAKRDGGT